MDTGAAQPARGMRDALPGLMRRRTWLVGRLVGTFQEFGFDPLDTPALERAEVLLGKYGPDAERLIFRAGLRGETDLALRYDHSVPLARVCAAYEDLPRPFKRYQVGSVWRGERPQKGRYREFVQADVDIVGSASLLADAEILAVALAAVDRLCGVPVRFLVNNRRVLTAVGRLAGVPDAMLGGLYRAIDKRDALGPAGARRELLAVGLPSELLNRERQAVARCLAGTADRERIAADLLSALSTSDPGQVAGTAIPRFVDRLFSLAATETDSARLEDEVMTAAIGDLRGIVPADAVLPEAVADRLLDALGAAGEPDAVLEALRSKLTDPVGQQGLDEVRTVLDALARSGADVSRMVVDPAMVRGLEYYTGIIFEGVVPTVGVGSVVSGGRYDNLVGSFGRDMPAVGLSFGVDRLVVALDELGLFPAAVDRAGIQVLVARFDEATTGPALALATSLRRAGLRVESYLDLDRLGEQIRYALRRDIPVVAIVGPDEAAAGAVTIRDLRLRHEAVVPVADAAGAIRASLAEDGPPSGSAAEAGLRP